MMQKRYRYETEVRNQIESNNTSFLLCKAICTRLGIPLCTFILSIYITAFEFYLLGSLALPLHSIGVANYSTDVANYSTGVANYSNGITYLRKCPWWYELSY